LGARPGFYLVLCPFGVPTLFSTLDNKRKMMSLPKEISDFLDGFEYNIYNNKMVEVVDCFAQDLLDLLHEKKSRIVLEYFAEEKNFTHFFNLLLGIMPTAKHGIFISYLIMKSSLIDGKARPAFHNFFNSTIMSLLQQIIENNESKGG
jgi:hypothetical protein